MAINNWENKTRRVQLVMQPSLYRAIRKEADECGASFNDFVCRFMNGILCNDFADIAPWESFLRKSLEQGYFAIPVDGWTHD